MEGLINDILQNKFKNLVSFLTEVTSGFYSIAEEIECSNLKTALIAMAVESKQYAKEISDQLQKFNVFLPAGYPVQLWEQIEMNVHEQASFCKGGEIVALCDNCERYYRELYEEVLKENIPFKTFKAIITYQLFATQCAFSKIRILNTIRFSK